MSSIPPDKQKDYENIQEGLKKGNRIVYDKRGKRFECMSTTLAKQAVKLEPDHYTSDLTQVKQAIEKFIQENEIDTTTSQNIEKAFQTRNDSLKERKFAKLFSKTKVETASKGLEACKEVVHKAAEKRLTQSAPATMIGGPKEKPTESTRQLKTPAGATKLGASPTSPEETSDIPQAPGIDGPPPPPAPPPPPGPGGAPVAPAGPSAIHKQLTQEADKLPKFAGEPNHPAIKKGLDIGDRNQLNSMSESERKTLSEEIKLYREGKETKQTTGKGATAKTTVVVDQKGLKHFVEPAEAVIKKHDQIEDDLKKQQLELNKLRNTSEQIDRTISKAQNCLSEGKPYAAKTAEKEAKTIKFHPKAVIDKMETPEDYYQRNGMPKPLSLEWKIEDLGQQKRDIDTQIKQDSERARKLQEALQQTEAEGLKMFAKPLTGGYEEFVKVTKQKRANLDTWKRRELALAPSKEKASPKGRGDAEEKQANLAATLSEPKYAPLKDQYELYSQYVASQSLALQAQMTKSPEQFGRNTQLEP